MHKEEGKELIQIEPRGSATPGPCSQDGHAWESSVPETDHCSSPNLSDGTLLASTATHLLDPGHTGYLRWPRVCFPGPQGLGAACFLSPSQGWHGPILVSAQLPLLKGLSDGGHGLRTLKSTSHPSAPSPMPYLIPFPWLTLS